MSVLVPPMIAPPVNGTWKNVNQSKSLTLTCTGSGIPVPNITWTRDGAALAGPMPGDATIDSVVGSQTLNHTIMSASIEDSGWYTCTASRTLKGMEYTAESKVYVDVLGEHGHLYFACLCVEFLV